MPFFDPFAAAFRRHITPGYGGRSPPPRPPLAMGPTPRRQPRSDAINMGRYMDWTTRNDLTPVIGPRLDWSGAQSVCLIGPPGSGKDVRILAPALFQNTGASLVVLDFKGVSAAISAPYRRTLGPVYIINPDNDLVDIPGYEDLQSTGWNPLAHIDPYQPSFPEECGYQADALISAEGSNDGTNAAFFIESANGLWQWATMTEVLAAKAESRPPSFANVRAFICMPSGYNERLKIDYGLPVAARAAMKSNIPALRNLASAFTVWNKEKEAIATEAKRQTKAFDDASIAHDMTLPGFDFRELKRRPCTVYIIISPNQLDRRARYLRLLVDQLMRAVMRPRMKGEPRCTFVLNEAYALGKLPILAKVQNLVREYGVSLVWMFQSRTQIQTVWGPTEMETLMTACGVVASFRAGDQSTADWLSKRCGDRTSVVSSFNQGTQQNTGGASQSSGDGWTQQKIPAVTPHDIFGLKDGQMIQFVQGVANFVSSYAPPFWMLDDCTRVARENPYHRPDRAA